MPRIELKDVTKRWGNFVGVSHLNLVIDDHAFVTLLGTSGCGKTTTLRMIAGLETPTEGTITIDGKVVFDSKTGVNLSPDKRNVGFLFQNYALWPHMTVYENISFGLKNLKWKKPDIENRVNELLKMLKIEEFVKRYPSELSGGQQQRVAIARTLAPNPSVLLMDEPLSNLDAKLRLEMRTELKRLHTDTKSTFIYVTHDQLEATTLATKVCLIDKGVLQQYAPPLEVYAKPTNLFAGDFVGNPAMNFVQAEITKIEGKKVHVKFEAHKGEINSLFSKPGVKHIENTTSVASETKDEEKQEILEEKTEILEEPRQDIPAVESEKNIIDLVFECNDDIEICNSPIAVENPVVDEVSEPEVKEKKKKSVFGKKKNAPDANIILPPQITDEMMENARKVYVGQKVVLGIRPEYIKLTEKDGIAGTIYSSLPAGMETTLKVKVGNNLLTSVVFGIIDYKMESPVKIQFIDKHILLFDKQSTLRISDGELKIK